MSSIQKRASLKRLYAVFLLSLIALVTTVSRVTSAEITVERIREFVCDMSAIGNQADIAMVENGEMGEAVFIRPADQECRFHLLHRSGSGSETQLTSSPGGYQIAQAAVLDNNGLRAICASDAEHTAVTDGEPNERRVQTVAIHCWVGDTGSFKPGVTVVGKDPEYAAWIARVEAHPKEVSTYRVVWVRDFSFQFLNMSDAGRPETDGTYETTFTLQGKKLVVGATTKLADTTMYGSTVTFEPWEPTPEELELLSQ